MIDQCSVVGGLPAVDALYEVKVRVRHIARAMHCDDGEDGQEEGEQVEVVDAGRAIGQGRSQQGGHQTRGQRPGSDGQKVRL